MANTTNFSIEKRTVGGYRNTWGGTLNTGLDKLDELIALAMPVGSVTMYTKSTAPTATASGGTWLVCDGSAISRTTYSALFTVIGTTFGIGDNNTTFNIPDLRARVPVGYNAGTIGSGATARTAKTVAAGSGTETHVLTTAELAAHSHAIPATAHNHDITDQSHSHAGANSGGTEDASLSVTDPGHTHTYTGSSWATAVGYYSATDSAANYSSVFGSFARVNVACTVNIGGAVITKKDSGETTGGDFLQFAGTETTLMTKEIDLKTAACHTMTIPTNAKFWVNEMGVISTNINTMTTQPTIKIGCDDTNTSTLMASLQTVELTTENRRERYLPATPERGLQTITVEIATGATATTACGRFYFKGMLVENE